RPARGACTEGTPAARRAAAGFDQAGRCVATDPTDPGRILGFHGTRVHTETAPPMGEVYVVGIDPSAQGRGLGRLLTLAGLRYLRERGLETVLLYTEADNTAAVNTYTKLGFTPFHVDIAYSADVPPAGDCSPAAPGSSPAHARTAGSRPAPASSCDRD